MLGWLDSCSLGPLISRLDWKSTKIRLVVAITHRSKESLRVMAKILATSELQPYVYTPCIFNSGFFLRD